MTLPDRKRLLATYRDTLLNDVIPFWMKHAIDREHGGVLTALDRDGSLLDSDKSVWAQGRTGWMFGELYNHSLFQTEDGKSLVDDATRSQWLEVSRSCVKFIDDHCVDSDGRLFFHMTREGQPIRKRRYAYSESFAAIANGELAKATGESRYAERAAELFQRFVDHNLNPTGVQPKFTDTRPAQHIGFSMIMINTASELRDSIGLEVADDWIERSIETILGTFVREDVQCVMELVGADGRLMLDHFDGRTLNPGHAIEGAWFIIDEGRRRDEQRWVDAGCQMLDWMWERGWDRDHGGLMYFVSADGRPIQEYWQDMKFWWPHNEAIIATLMAALVTDRAEYWDWHEQVHTWSFDQFADPQFGEWFGYLRRDGEVTTPLKGNLWKGPFHLPRMLLVCWELLESNLAA